jgi:predicted RNase H-like HicB family nuclease
VTHYIAVFVENDVGEWRVVFPHVPGCEAKGFSLEDAKLAATSALQRCIKKNGSSTASPTDKAPIHEWLSQNHIDLSRAIVTAISVVA